VAIHQANTEPIIAPGAVPMAAFSRAFVRFSCAKSFVPEFSDQRTEMSVGR
jgi:hypothetical protein